MTSRLRRIRKWTLRIFAAFAILLVIARISLPYVLPWLVGDIAPGFRLEWDELDLSLTGGSVKMRNVQLGETNDQGDLDPERLMLELEYLNFEISTLALLTGFDIEVGRVELDGADIHLRRHSDGLWNFERLSAGEEEDEQAVDDEDESDPNAALPSSLGFELFAGRVQHIRVDVTDESVSPAIETWLDATLRVSHLGQDDRDGRASLTIVGEHLEVLRLDTRWQTPGDDLFAQTRLELEGLTPGGLEAWLEPMGLLNESTTSIDFGLAIESELRRGDGGNDGPALLGLNVLNGQLKVDNGEIVGFDKVDVRIRDLLSSGGLVEQLVIERPRARVEIDERGDLAFGSLRLTSVENDSTNPPVSTSSSAPAEEDESEPSRWALSAVAIRDAEFDFVDRSKDPIAEISGRDFGLEWSGLEDLTDTDLRVRGRIPGVAENLSLRGSATVAEPEISAGLDLSLSGMTFRNVKPWLDEAGIQVELSDASLEVALQTSVRPEDDAVRGSFTLSEFRFSDATSGETETLFRLDELSVTDFEFGGARSAIDRVVVAGLHTSAEIDSDGVMRTVGLAFGGTAPTSSSALSTEPPTETNAPSETQIDEEAANSLELKSLELRDIAFGWSDRSVEPAVALEALSIEGSVSDLLLSPEEGRGTWRLDLSTDNDLFDQFEVSGQVEQDTESRSLTTRWSSTGLRLDSVAGYLSAAGLESTFESGGFSGRLDWTQSLTNESSDIELTDLTLEDGERELFRSPSIRVLDMTDSGIERVVVEGIRTGVHRLADGRIETCGLRTTIPEESASQPVQTAVSGDAPANLDRPEQDEPEPTAGVESGFTIGSVRVEDLVVALADDAIQPPLETEARLRVIADDFENGLPASVQATLGVPELIEAIELNAQLTDGGDSIRAGFDIRHPTDKVEAYLPPNIELLDSRLTLRGEVVAELGDPTVELRLEKLRLESPSAPSPWIDIPVAQLRGRFGKDESTDIVVEVGGVRAIARQAEGALEVAGLRILDEAPADRVRVENSGSESESTEPIAIPALGSQPRPKPLRLHLEKLDLEVADLEWTDRRSARPAPVHANLKIATASPFRIGFNREDDDDRGVSDSPLELSVQITSPRILDSFRVESIVDLTRLEPEIDVSWELDGLKGPALTNALPALAESVDTSELTHGRFVGELHLTLHADRDATGLPDLEHEFGFDLQLRDLALSPTQDGEDAISLADFEILARRISPNGAVSLDSVDLAGLRAEVEKTPHGLHFAGVTLLTDNSAEETTAPSTPEGATPDEGEPEDFPSESETAAAPFRLGRLSVQDTSFRFVDSTGDKRVVLPIDQIEVDVQGLDLSSNDTPVRFSLYLQAGDTELPVPEPQESVFGGILSSATNLVTGPNDRGTEIRPLFETIGLTGQTTLGKEPTGRVRLDVSEFELMSLQPFATPADIDVRSGRFTTRINVDLKGAEGIQVGSRLVFQDLGLTDSGNTISDYLGLNAPINTVLFALRNSSGQQVIPLSFGLDSAGGVDTTEIAGAASQALASVVGEAIATAGLRVAAPLTNLLPFGGPEQTEPLAPLEVRFAAGGIDWEPTDQALIDEAVAFLLSKPNSVLILEHAMSAADQERAARLANPDPERLASIVSRMRQRRSVLRTERLRRLPEVRRLYGSGRLQEADKARAIIQDLDQEIGQIEAALDELLRLLRPGAERRTDRRTRAAATEIATQRLRRIEDALWQRLGPAYQDRIDAKSGRGAVVEGLERGIVRIQRRFRAGS